MLQLQPLDLRTAGIYCRSRRPFGHLKKAGHPNSLQQQVLLFCWGSSSRILWWSSWYKPRQLKSSPAIVTTYHEVLGHSNLLGLRSVPLGHLSDPEKGRERNAARTVGLADWGKVDHHLHLFSRQEQLYPSVQIRAHYWHCRWIISLSVYLVFYARMLKWFKRYDTIVRPLALLRIFAKTENDEDIPDSLYQQTLQVRIQSRQNFN